MWLLRKMRIQSAYGIDPSYVYNVRRQQSDERKAYWNYDGSNHAQHPFFLSYLVQISYACVDY